jgi:xylulokinase
VSKRFLLGVDLGTTATKAALYRRDGVLVSEGRADVPIVHPQPGWVEQDSEDFYRSALMAVRRCLTASSIDPTEIAGIAFDSQMAGLGTIDEDFRPATRFDSWLDMRCQPYIEELKARHADRIIALTGCPPTCNHGPKILWWMHERPEDYRRIAKFVMPACYVAGRTAGLRADEAFIDYTFLHLTTLADVERGAWSRELCDLLGVDVARLPRIVEPWEVIGEVREQAAREFGLVPGTPIAAGCGDTAAGALGAGVVLPGMLLDTAGTASVLACCTDRYVADRKHRALLTMRSVVPGVWNPLGYIGGGGMALRWFRDHLSESDGSYERLFEAAAKAPAGCDGLLFSPHLGGRICPAAPEMRGAWLGFSWGHRQEHFFRAILESVAYEYAYYLKILRELLSGLKLVEARVIGGGSQSPLWNQIKADILQVPYKKVMRAESATWGSALVAGKASGLIDDLAAAALETAPAAQQVIVPNAALRETYEKTFERYLGWQRELEDGFEKWPNPLESA